MATSINASDQDRLWETTRRVVHLLVAGRYEDLEKLCHGVRLSATQLRGAVMDYGRVLQPPPSPVAARFQPISIRDADPPAWAIACDLWSDGAPSDLTLELTVRAEPHGLVVQLDNLHVL